MSRAFDAVLTFTAAAVALVVVLAFNVALLAGAVWFVVWLLRYLGVLPA